MAVVKIRPENGHMTCKSCYSDGTLRFKDKLWGIRSSVEQILRTSEIAPGTLPKFYIETNEACVFNEHRALFDFKLQKKICMRGRIALVLCSIWLVIQ